jgi:hypothetical protein
MEVKFSFEWFIIYVTNPNSAQPVNRALFIVKRTLASKLARNMKTISIGRNKFFEVFGQSVI